MASHIANLVSTLQLRLKVEQVTSTDDEPTPVYLMDEAVQMIGSSSKTVKDAVDVIQQRLQHRSPYVKQKALRLVKHAAQRGSPELRRALARHATAVRELQHFRCAPDPFKGDIPWKRVQEAAKEALDALHAAPSAQQPTAAPSLGVRIQGFGSDAGSRSGLMGFGSDAAGTGERRTMVGFGGGGGGGQSANAMLDSFSTGVKGLTDRAMGALTRPQHTLLSSDADDGDRFSYAPSTSSLDGGAQITPSLGGSAPLPESQQQSAEHRVVARVCTPGGLRVAPSADDLKVFVEAVAALNGTEVARQLQEKLENGSWQEALRALCALEALLVRDTSAAAGEAAVHFQGAPEAVRRARQSTQASVRQRAERVLKLIGDETLPAAASPAGAAAAQGAADLLGRLTEEAPSHAGGVPAAAAATSPLDLLAGLDAAPAPQVPSPLDLLRPAGNGAPAPSAAPSPAGDDLFGDWAASPTPTPASAPSPAALGDIFGVDSRGAASPAGVSPPQARPDLAGALAGLGLGISAATLGGAPMARTAAPSVASRQPAAVWDLGPAPAAAAAFTLQPSDPHFATLQPQTAAPLGGASVAHAAPRSAFASASLHGRAPSLGHPKADMDVLSALHAATSGISSSKREDQAFSFVDGAMQQLKKK